MLAVRRTKKWSLNMSTKTFDSALDFVPAAKPGKPFLTALFDGLREGFEMASRYQQLTDRGVAPSDAAKTAVKEAEARR